VRRLVESELESARLARMGVWVQAIYGVVAAVSFSVLLTEMLDWIDEVRELPAGTDAHVPDPSVPMAFYGVQLLGLLQLGALIVWVVWQHRANTAASALGLPLTRSPGWGVGGWFIPLVNFWFPYEAARDNLPHGHPARPVVLHWWLGFLGQSLAIWPVAIAWAAGGAGIGLMASAAHVALAMWWVTRAERVLATTSEEHRRLAGLTP
jgi:hypothetical protein